MRLPLFVFPFRHPTASRETRREAFFFRSIVEWRKWAACPTPPPTRNEDWPGSCEVKRNKGSKGNMKMKRLKITMAIVAMAFGIVGCNNNMDGWYPISGGYINLRNVHTITSGFSDRPFVPEQPITKESIALCKKRVAESKDVPIISKAWIKFDDITINLPTDAKSKKDVLRLLDLYLDTMESLELPTK